tara:strand:+ start:9124 stop:9723 length:600 start_codon:yes stop_codon:yes gene_type:complete
MDCPICMDKITTNEKVLTCGHKLHYGCYIELILYSKNQFMECPLCREVNINTERYSTDSKQNIEIICRNKKRCRCRTQKGTVCKRKPKLLNYGYCYQHNKAFLKEELYPVMDDYISIVLCQRYTFLPRLYFLDIGKKMIIKYGEKGKVSCVDILTKILQYMSVKKIYYVNDHKEIYTYFGIDEPEKSWIDECIGRRYIF